MTNPTTHEDLQAALVARAVEDEAFRARLIDDPKAAIEDALGIVVPESIIVAVHEDGPTSAHLVLPPTTKLNEDDLQALAADHGWRAGPYTSRRVPRR